LDLTPELAHPANRAHGNVLSLAHHLESEGAKTPRSLLTLGHPQGTWPSGWEGRFRDECLQQRRIVRQDFSAKRLDVKPDGGLDVRESFLVTAAFANHHPLQAKGVRHIAIRVLLDNDFDLPHHAYLKSTMVNRFRFWLFFRWPNQCLHRRIAIAKGSTGPPECLR
jgi:hypothetical protein